MNPNYDPIVAYCQARIDALERLPDTLARASVIAELKQVIVLANGLTKQFNLIDSTLKTLSYYRRLTLDDL